MEKPDAATEEISIPFMNTRPTGHEWAAPT